MSTGTDSYRQPTPHAASSDPVPARPLRILLVSGIYPPDIGGPATHVVDLAEELSARGHGVTVLTLWDGPKPDTRPGLVRLPRRWPSPVRMLAVAGWIVRHRGEFDVVYATGLQAEAVAGSRVARRPVVVKIVGDPAWERGRRLGLTTQEFTDFQVQPSGSPALRAMCALRNWSVKPPAVVMVPSEFLAGCVRGWRGAEDVAVVPNGVRTRPSHEASTRNGPLERLTVVSRLAEHKRIDVLVEAVATTPGLQLEIIGDGPDRERLETLSREHGVLGSAVTFIGSLSHADVMSRLGQADALVSASSYEGLPHVVIEALAVGTPVIASPAGGIPEVLGGGIGGVIVDPPTVEGFARVLGELRDDQERMRRLREGARTLGRQWQFSTTVEGIEQLLLSSAT